MLTDSTIADNMTGPGGHGGRGASCPHPTFGGIGGLGGLGAGVYNAGAVTVQSSTLSGNTAGAGGDGGQAPNPGNVGSPGTGGDGGGKFNAGTLTATNTTIAANAAGTGGQQSGAPGTGGGLVQASTGGATLTSVTIAQNTALRLGSQLEAEFGPVSITGSVIGLGGMQACSGQITDGGFNVSLAGPECPGTHADPKLGPLQSNGGPTQTMALAPGSPALDLVPANGLFCPPTDQRGVHRPQGAACDAGAYELAPPTISAASAVATSPGTAIVTASIDPNLQDTTVTVHYGPTTAVGSVTSPQDLGTGSTPVELTVPLTGLQANTTLHVEIAATNGDGQARSVDMVLTTPPVGGQAAPSVTGLRESARRWLEPVARHRRQITHSRRLPIGTMFTFKLNENARVTLQFIQLRRRWHPRRVGALTLPGREGTNRLRFLGRLAHHRTLAPSRYRLVVVATTPPGRRSAPAQITFTIVRKANAAR